MRTKSTQRWLAGVILAMLVLSSIAARAPSNGNPIASVRGTVYDDANRNGQLDSSEKGLPGISVVLTSGDFSHTYTTGDDGSYGPMVGAGNWTVTLTVPEGWSPTTATTYSVSVDNNKAVTGLDFGLKQGAAKSTSGGAASAPASSGSTSTSTSPGALPTTGGEAQPSPLPLVALLLVICAAIVLALAMPQSKSAKK